MFNKKEHSTIGSLIQLYAKGPQDTYLTGDAWKYIPPWYNYGYNNYGSYGGYGGYNNYGRYGRYKYNYPYYGYYPYYRYRLGGYF